MSEEYRWSDHKRRYFLDGEEIFIEKYVITSNGEVSIHEMFTIKKLRVGNEYKRV